MRKYVIKIIDNGYYVREINFNMNRDYGNFDIFYIDESSIALKFRLKSNAKRMAKILNNSQLKYKFRVEKV